MLYSPNLVKINSTGIGIGRRSSISEHVWLLQYKTIEIQNQKLKLRQSKYI